MDKVRHRLWIVGLAGVLIAAGWHGRIDHGAGYWASKEGESTRRFAAVYSSESQHGPTLAVTSYNEDQRHFAHNVAIFVRDGRPMMQVHESGTRAVYMIDLINLAKGLKSEQPQDPDPEEDMAAYRKKLSKWFETHDEAPPASWYPNGDPWRGLTAEEQSESVDPPSSDPRGW